MRAKIVAALLCDSLARIYTHDMLEDHDFAEDPEHQSHLEDEDGVEEAPVQREAEQGDPAAVVP